MARQRAYATEYRARHPDIPVVERLDLRMLEILDRGDGKLDMGAWHTCETTHCRAGWTTKLAGEAGAALEARVGPKRAGEMIYLASCGYAPHFFATTDRALDDLRKRAAEAVLT